MPKYRPRLPYHGSLKEKAGALRNNPTSAEKLFCNALRGMPFYAEIAFNRQKPLGNYSVDIYCHRFRLAIEIDGDAHGETAIYDSRRTACLEARGLKVLRFTNREALSNIEGVMARLTEALHEQGFKSPGPLYERGR